jgi:hypothetical protein
VIECENLYGRNRGLIVAHCCTDIPIKIEVEVRFTSRMQRRHKRNAVVFPPIALMLCSPTATFVHAFTRKTRNKICESQICSAPFGSAERLRLDVLNMRRFLLNPTHRVCAKSTLFPDQCI